jgi:hypothetical protein
VTIVAQMQEMSASSKPPYQVPLETDARQGVEVLGLNQAGIAQAQGIISLYTLLHAASGTVATDAQYQALRDQFIASLASCMADPAQ